VVTSLITLALSRSLRLLLELFRVGDFKHIGYCYYITLHHIVLHCTDCQGSFILWDGWDDPDYDL